jgi:hypothetical protein
VVPDTFRFLYPQDGDTVTLSDSLGWTRSRTAAGYYFSVLTDYNGESSMYDVVIGNDSTGQGYDSTKVHFPGLFFYYGDKPGWKTLAVYAVDSNYFDWMRLVGYGGGGGTPPETTHLTGGLGVFGSAAVETLRFYLRTDTTSRTQPYCPTGAVEDKPDVGCQNAGAAPPRVTSCQLAGCSERKRLGAPALLWTIRALDATRSAVRRYGAE